MLRYLRQRGICLSILTVLSIPINIFAQVDDNLEFPTRQMYENRGFNSNWSSNRVNARKAASDFLNNNSRAADLFTKFDFQLREIHNGHFIVNHAHTVDAVMSINGAETRDNSYFLADGDGITVGMWDAGMPRETHQELTGRVSSSDGATVHYHSTMVAGVLAASGVNERVKGMLPAAMLNCFDWTDDDLEMADYAMATSGQVGKVSISNHSYGVVNGWVSLDGIWYWSGISGQDECAYFGNYYYSYPFDVICNDSPYYLPVWAAGNDRSDGKPSDGATYYEYGDFDLENPMTYDASSGPKADNWDNGGFDTVDTFACAKNILTVGSVTDAVATVDGELVRNIANANMATHSAWGPTDDGRIKPDVVANGYLVYTCSYSNDSSYTTSNGTSLAAPGAAGAAGQLASLYLKLFPGEYMLSSTLKGLIIHTADDMGNAGPDYKYGWGLINALEAAELLVLHKYNPDSLNIVEDSLERGRFQAVDDEDTFTFESDGTEPVKVTLCWTDKPGSYGSPETLDNTTLRLVNDLDLQIVAPDSSVYLPYVLDPANPAELAAAGTNIRDNVEQVYISDPVPGQYTVIVNYSQMDRNTLQRYSLLVSGQTQNQPGDFNTDGEFNIADFAVIAANWLGSDTAADIFPSFGDSIVDMSDISWLLDKWLN